MRLFNRNPYEAFLKYVCTNPQKALYYISKMSAEDLNRPMTDKQIEKADLPRYCNGYSPLMLCATLIDFPQTTNMPVLMKALLERGADLYFMNRVGYHNEFRSFFHILRERTVTKELMTLLKPYLDVTKPASAAGDNILMLAIQYEYIRPLLKVLTPEQIKDGLSYCNNCGISPLTMAVQKDGCDNNNLSVILSYAQKVGIDLNGKDKNGDTISSAALTSWTYLPGVLKSLQQHGADLNAPVYDGETLLMTFIRNHQEIKFERHLYSSWDEAFSSTWHTLLKMTDVNARVDKKDPTALCLAVRLAAYDMIEKLIQYGAKIEREDAEVFVSNLLNNKKLSEVEQVNLLHVVQKQMPDEAFNVLLETCLRKAYKEDNGTSLIRTALIKQKDKMAEFLMDCGFSPLDEIGCASSVLSDSHPLKQLLQMYEDTYQKTNGQIMPTNCQQAFQKTLQCLRHKNYSAVQFVEIFGALFNSMGTADKAVLQSRGLFAAARLQHAMNPSRTR